MMNTMTKMTIANNTTNNLIIFAICLLAAGLLNIIYAWNNWKYYKEKTIEDSAAWDHYKFLLGGILCTISGIALLIAVICGAYPPK